MEVFFTIDLNIFCLILCTGMIIVNLRLGDRHMILNRLFRLLIIVTMSLLLLESVTWAVNSKPGALARILNYASNTIGFIMAPFPSAIWTFYASYQLFHDMDRLRTEMRVLTVPILINALIALSTPFTGLLYTIDAGNSYHRGSIVGIFALISLLPVLYTAVSYIANRKNMPRSMFIPMLLFAVPPISGAVFQTLFYGISVIWSAITVSIFIVHTGIQNKQFYMDHLTGVYNRRQLDSRLDGLLRTHRKQLGRQNVPRYGDFACIMVDIDNFKFINDNFGHLAGDEALKNAAVLLQSCIRRSDFLARYAGDEFVILLDTDTDEAVQQTIRRIHDKAEKFNTDGTTPYRLDFSAGYEICRRGNSITREELLSRVDARMYQEKSSRRISAVCVQTVS